MIVLLLLHLVVGIGLIAASRWLAAGGRRTSAFAIAAVPSAATVAWLAAVAARASSTATCAPATSTWIPSLGVDLDLRLDGFAALMVLLVAGIGVLVFAYAWRYFATRRRPTSAASPACSCCSPGRCSASSWPTTCSCSTAFWELTSVTSFLLIGNRPRRTPRPGPPRCRRCSSPAPAALAMLGGFVVLGQAAGTYRLSEIARRPAERARRSTVALVLVLLGAFTKSAQYPFHAWLPGAMVAPDAGQRLPALGDDGEGRRLPRRPVRPGVRRPSASWRPARRRPSGSSR